MRLRKKRANLTKRKVNTMVKGATCRSLSTIGVLASVGATVTFGLCAGEEPKIGLLQPLQLIREIQFVLSADFQRSALKKGRSTTTTISFFFIASDFPLAWQEVSF